MRCRGVVVASTTGRPAAWCCSMSESANGWMTAAIDSAAASAAASKVVPSRPLASSVAWRARKIEGSVSPMRSNMP